jgi:predicted Zn-dependent protease
MSYPFGRRIWDRTLTRRDFLRLASASTVSTLVPLLSGCAVDPVTGEQQMVLMSEAQERAADREQSPHQFSSDYGIIAQQEVNDYVNRVGQDMARRSHRPGMPYSFQVVNASYINAYTFPGGSTAATRGILVEMDNEAELAGLLGHEIGHVNARHAAERATRSTLTGLAVAGLGVAVSSSRYSNYGGLVNSLGQVGAGALLAHYSRDDEREADALGMEYMARAGHSPEGMVELMDMLRSESKYKPSAIETMFSTHPMSDERYATAKARARSEYGDARGRSLERERYMDNIASLRRLKPTIDALQKGEKLMNKDDFRGAEPHVQEALRYTPDDYAGLVMMAKCQIGLERPEQARRFADRAKQVNPQEAQARHVDGVARLMQQDYAGAYADFKAYERLLPGNPNTVFLAAVSLEGARDRQGAAKEYYRYLKLSGQGAQAQHAYQRLQAWGYLK